MKKIGHAILKYLLRALGALPLGFHHACGRVLGFIAGEMIRYRRDIVMTNLARSFPDKKYAELKSICKEFYRHFGDVIGEAVWFGGCTDPQRLKDAGIVRMTNPEELERLYAGTGSVFVLAAHTGNWELFGGYVSYADNLKVPENDVCVVYKKLSSEVWERLMRDNRRAPIADKEHYDGLVESMDVMRYMLTNKSGHKVYNFITDQYPYRGSRKVAVGEFMHQPTVSMDGGAKLAAKFGMSVAYLSYLPESRGHYTMTFKTICDDASQMSPEDIMKQYYKLLQEDLEAAPWNWLWTHKRWK